VAINQLEIFERLGLRPGGILIRGVEITHWGKLVIIYAEYTTVDETLPFRLFFENCAEITWQSLTDESAENPDMADVSGILFGTNQSLETCIITTDLFEIIASYAQLTIAQDWQSQG